MKDLSKYLNEAKPSSRAVYFSKTEGCIATDESTETFNSLDSAVEYLYDMGVENVELYVDKDLVKFIQKRRYQ